MEEHRITNFTPHPNPHTALYSLLVTKSPTALGVAQWPSHQRCVLCILALRLFSSKVSQLKSIYCLSMAERFAPNKMSCTAIWRWVDTITRPRVRLTRVLWLTAKIEQQINSGVSTNKSLKETNYPVYTAEDMLNCLWQQAICAARKKQGRMFFKETPQSAVQCHETRNEQKISDELPQTERLQTAGLHEELSLGDRGQTGPPTKEYQCNSATSKTWRNPKQEKQKVATRTNQPTVGCDPRESGGFAAEKQKMAVIAQHLSSIQNWKSGNWVAPNQPETSKTRCASTNWPTLNRKICLKPRQQPALGPP